MASKAQARNYVYPKTRVTSRARMCHTVPILFNTAVTTSATCMCFGASRLKRYLAGKKG